MRQTPLNALLSASLPACVARTGALTLYSVGIVVLAVMAQTGVPRLRAELAFQGEVCGASALTAYQSLIVAMSSVRLIVVIGTRYYARGRGGLLPPLVKTGKVRFQCSDGDAK
jgi:hypothetical protein